MTKTTPKPKAAAKRKQPAQSKQTVPQKIAAHGIDAIVEAVSSAKTMTEIATAIGVTVGQLSTWIAADAEHSARVREARSIAARYWDERSEEEIRLAMDPFELARAKELAHHYRWRASKIAPREYGDKVQAEVSGPGGGALQIASTVTFVRPPARTED